jgi:hypothetical protein
LPSTYWRLNWMANNKRNQSWAGQVENLVSYYQKKKKVGFLRTNREHSLG